MSHGRGASRAARGRALLVFLRRRKIDFEHPRLPYGVGCTIGAAVEPGAEDDDLACAVRQRVGEHGVDVPSPRMDRERQDSADAEALPGGFGTSSSAARTTSDPPFFRMARSSGPRNRSASESPLRIAGSGCFAPMARYAVTSSADSDGLPGSTAGNAATNASAITTAERVGDFTSADATCASP